MLNRAIVQGRITKDIMLHKLDENDNLASFVIACERDSKNKNTGKRGVDFIDVVAKGRLADFVAKTFKQNDIVIVTGRLKRREFTDENGIDRSGIEIVCDSVYYG